MLPTIPSGSLAITKKSFDYEVGEIVAFEQKEGAITKVIVHRIIEKLENGFIIKGDNNPDNDPGIIPPEKIIGKVIFVTPYLGYLALFLKNPLVLTLSVIAVGTIMTPNKKEKKEQDNHSMFLPAVAIMLLDYAVLQIAISMSIAPRDDFYTTFLFGILEPYVASTLSFASWFFTILGIHLLGRHEMSSAKRHVQNVQTNAATLVKKESKSMKTMSQIFLTLFIMMKITYIVAMLVELVPKLI
jgi:signal peptidase